MEKTMNENSYERLPEELKLELLKRLPVKKRFYFFLTSQSKNKPGSEVWSSLGLHYNISFFQEKSVELKQRQEDFKKFVTAVRIAVSSECEKYPIAKKILETLKEKYNKNPAILYYLINVIIVDGSVFIELFFKSKKQKLSLIEQLRALPLSPQEKIMYLFPALVIAAQCVHLQLFPGCSLSLKDKKIICSYLQEALSILGVNIESEKLLGLRDDILSELLYYRNIKILIKFTPDDLEKMDPNIRHCLLKEEGKNFLERFNLEQLLWIQDNMLENALVSPGSYLLYEMFTSEEILSLKREIIHSLTFPENSVVFENYKNNKNELMNQLKTATVESLNNLAEASREELFDKDKKEQELIDKYNQEHDQEGLRTNSPKI
jgi:hypothetical protein